MRSLRRLFCTSPIARSYSSVASSVAPAIEAISKPPHSSTPLVKHLRDVIEMRGPLSVGTFMRSCLIHPTGGYYMSRDVFGTQGDFTTAPEMSQLFGELLALWFITHLKSTTTWKKVRLLELGPGRGTLMSDILRTLSQYKGVLERVESVHMVEASPHLRGVQASALGSEDVKDEENPPEGAIRVHWHEYLEDVPTGLPTFIIAHEFFDALPIYKFEKTVDGWREIMVDVSQPSKADTTTTKTNENEAQFRFVLSKSPASSTMLLDPRYDSCQIGDRVEVCPEGAKYARQLAERLQADQGCGMYIDYGIDGIPSDSLRAIKDHKFVDIFTAPGLSDLSADVDFSLLRQASSSLVSVHGPMTQGTFLKAMGIQPRLQALLQRANASQRKDLSAAFDRLTGTGDEQMGRVYKVMGVTCGSTGTPYPFNLCEFDKKQNSN